MKYNKTKMFLIIIVSLIFCLVLTGCKKESIKIDIVNTIEVGQVSGLKYIGENLKKKTQITWSVEDSNIITLNEKVSSFYAKNPGTTKITLSTSSGLTVSAIITVTALKEIVSNILYILNEGEFKETAPTTYVEGKGLTLEVPVKEGYTFLGWSKENDSTTYITNISENETGEITLYANWLKDEIVSNIIYNLNDGEFKETAPTTYVEGKSLTLEVPVKEGYTFLGWSKENDSTTYITNISENETGEITLYANWLKDEIVSNIIYNLNEGEFEETAPTTYVEGKSLTLEVPVKEGYTFLGWSKENDSTTYITNISENETGEITLYANWQKDEIVSNIIYNLNEGEFEETAPTTYVEGKSLTLEVPVKEGYTFLGWSKTSTSTTYIKVIGSSYTGDVTLYANWQKIPVKHDITYVIGDATLPAGAQKQYTEGVQFTLPIPIKNNYSFLGWTKTENDKQYIKILPATENKDLTLYAQFEKTIFTINYNFEDGAWPTRKSKDIFELFDYLLTDFYNWLGLTTGLNSFIKGSDGKYSTGTWYTKYKASLYTANDSGIKENSNYFINDEENNLKWLNFFNELDKCVTEVNGAQSFWGSTYVGCLRLMEMGDNATRYTTSQETRLISTINIPLVPISSYKKGTTATLLELTIEDGRTFLGWYDASDNKVTEITSTMACDLELNAVWSESTHATGFTLNNPITEIIKFDKYQLTWAFTPETTTNKRLLFTSSNDKVLTINEKGIITAISNGNATITVIVKDNNDLNVTMNVKVYIPDFIEGDYDTVSYVKVGSNIVVNANIVGDSTGSIVWETEDSNIATVQNGIITGVKAGFTNIIAKDTTNSETKLAFGVTVLNEVEDDIINFVVDNHNTEIYTKPELNIAGAYTRDIYGSASKLLFNYDYKVTEKLISTSNDCRPGTKLDTLEFITVHYTAGTSKGSGGEATANYFGNPSTQASAHYCTGNDGIFQCLPDDEVGWHAGDGTKIKFTWTATGVYVKATDPVRPVVTITTNSKFAINGTETGITCPSGEDKSGNYIVPKSSSYLTFLGPAIKVVNNQYYIGSTWWCNSQVAAGRVCSRGGNLNSIGIESAVNIDSDLWYTWQITAQLVANLVYKYNLDLSRVVGHNFFSGKNCPQPMLENDGEIWYQFEDLIEAEYNYIKSYKDYQITSVSNDLSILSNNGRIINQPNYTTTVSYTLTITKGSSTKTITLSTIVKGLYS